MDSGTNRRTAGWLAGGLFLLGVGLFLVPFAFPTPPPIVKGFRATYLFSPNADGKRDIARVSFRMNEAGTATVTVSDPADRGGALRKVLHEGPRAAGVFSVDWDGTDANGADVGDGRYVITLRARSGRKQWNSSRATELDRTPPVLGMVTARSAVLAGAGEGQCRIAATALERGSLSLEAIPAPGTGAAIARKDTATVAAGQSALWNWDGALAAGGPAAPGLYVIHATLTDRARSSAQKTVTCWIGHGTGTTVPARPTLGDRVRVQLRDAAGRAVGGSTPVTLSIARRGADPGGTDLAVVGARVGGVARGPVGRTEVTLPRKIPLRSLWLIASTPTQRVLIPLRP